MKKTVLSIIIILVLVGAGIILWKNPLVISPKVTEYKNVIPDGFPSDFPGDPNIVQITKNQKTVSSKGETEFILGYYTTKPSTQTLQDITKYALSKDLNNINDGSGVNEEGNDYSYFSAENDAKTQKISVTSTVFPDSGGALSSVEIKIWSK